MRYFCHSCGKSVTSELPDDSTIRAALFCPECIQENKVVVLPKKEHEWRFYMNGSFCIKCGEPIGTNKECR